MDVQLRHSLERHLAIFACPRCESDLEMEDEGLRCTACGTSYGVSRNIPLLFCPNEWDRSRDDVTLTVKSFYEETPFPNYDDFDNVGWLVEKARKGVFAKLLDDQIPPGVRILECGCGTGQMSNFLSVASRTVFGSDMSLHSLSLGEEFKEKNDLETVHFVQMNLFRPCFKPGQFDVVLCNGVLHHTSAPFGGFSALVPLVRPGGHIIIGLYNTYGRLGTNLRRQIFRLSGGRGRWLDPYLRTRLGAEKRRAWFADQYQHPHESTHTIGEVLHWFDETGLQFVRGIPSVTPEEERFDEAGLFRPAPRGSALDHFVSQARQIVTGNREGGFFLMIGQRAAVPAQRAAEPAADTIHA
jgi:2-polyprenyl-3-methyl-5-hydroxy-6-metoxy-1,4-benzoquinol methylase/uncharacterized protein YbaR (Trm112 family)